jgi:predicted  nucleic acid-binding Zn-ribbon protein
MIGAVFESFVAGGEFQSLDFQVAINDEVEKFITHANEHARKEIESLPEIDSTLDDAIQSTINNLERELLEFEKHVGDLHAQLKTGPSDEDIASDEALLADDGEFTTEIARYRTEIAAKRKENLDSSRRSEEPASELEDLKHEALELRRRVVTQGNADRRKFAGLRRTAALFVDHAFELSDVMTQAFARFPDLPERESPASRPRERFGQAGENVITEIERLVRDLGKTRGQWDRE